ncbi:MAG: hypothetical protein PHF79_02985 [Candidatus Pacebacteria bacterium]|nr:hypothetical protein [Candidatus Paceibacterota bacterium]
METKFQTSFIPKKPISSNGGIEKTRGVNIFTLVAFFIFFVSLAAAGGVFVYKAILQKSIDYQQQQLVLAQKDLNPSTLETYVRLSDRIRSVKTILHTHIQASNLFGIISRNTLPTVRFNDFNLAYQTNKVTLTMHGQAINYDSVALQDKAFSDPTMKTIFHSPIFSGLDVDSGGNIVFTFTASVDPSQLLYYTSVESMLQSQGDQSAQQAQQQPAQTQPASATSSAGFTPLPSNR